MGSAGVKAARKHVDEIDPKRERLDLEIFLAYVDISKEKGEVEIRNILLLLTLRLKKQTKSNPGKHLIFFN